MDFDTGSADIWIPIKRYNHDDSMSYAANNQPFQISYGFGGSSGTVNGFLSYDTITMGNLSCRSQLFAEATSTNSLYLFTDVKKKKKMFFFFLFVRSNSNRFYL